MEIAQKIYELRKKNKMTLEQVGNFVGVGKSTVRKWETGFIENMRKDKVLKLAECFGVSPGYLLGYDDNEEHVGNPKSHLSGVRIPVLGNVAAGIPIEAITDVEDFEEITPDIAATGEFVALRIHGQSMEPRMHEGDVVIVRVQDTAETGDVAIVLVNGNDATCKKIKKTPEGVMLISLNPAYEPMFYSNKQIAELPVRIFGRVVELRAKF